MISFCFPLPGCICGSFSDSCLELLGIKRSLKCHRKSRRKLASKKVTSEARVPESIPGWGQEGGNRGGKPPSWGGGGSEERKKRRKGKGK